MTCKIDFDFVHPIHPLWGLFLGAPFCFSELHSCWCTTRKFVALLPILLSSEAEDKQPLFKFSEQLATNICFDLHISFHLIRIINFIQLILVTLVTSSTFQQKGVMTWKICGKIIINDFGICAHSHKRKWDFIFVISSRSWCYFEAEGLKLNSQSLTI